MRHWAIDTMAVRVTFTRSYLAGDVLKTRFVHFSSKDQSRAKLLIPKRGMGLAKSPCQSSVNISQCRQILSVLSDSFTLCTITSLPHVGRVATTSKQTSGARLYHLPRWRGVIPDGNSSKWCLLNTIAHIPLILNIQYSKYIFTWLSTTMEYHVLFMLHFNTCHAKKRHEKRHHPSPSLASHLGYACQLRGFRRPHLLFRKWPETQWKLRTSSWISIWFPCDFHVISHLVNSIWADDILDLLPQLWPGKTRKTTNQQNNHRDFVGVNMALVDVVNMINM